MARVAQAGTLGVVLPHVGMSALALAALAGAALGAIQFLGDPTDAGPSVLVALPAPPPEIRAQTREVSLTQPAGTNPSLGVADPAAGAPGGARLPPPVLTPPKDGPVRIMFGRPPADAPPAPVTGGSVRIIAPGDQPAGRGFAKGPALAPAPIAGLSQPGPQGLLPMIASDGRTPAQAYARPFADSGRPKIALVIGGLGLNTRQTEAAIAMLPPEVTLSFVPYADNLQEWINRARANGHEVLIEAPMEPFDYPDNDPGPHTLLSTAPADENQRRFDFVLSRAQGYFGVTNYLGGKFAGGPASEAILASAKARGLAFVSDGTARGFADAARRVSAPFASADRVIDARPARGAIEQQLLALETLAKSRGMAMGAGVAYPVTLDEIGAWARGLSGRGIDLAPASALVRRPS
jgi:polysaccharide deacetylase 2 family uncharacterized protein YibQ